MVTSSGDRRFSEEEVALIIKRAAELQQTEEAAEEPGHSMTLSEVEQIAKEAGIDPLLIRRAAHGLDRPAVTNRPSPWTGAPTRLVFESSVDGEIPVEEFEPLVNEIRRTFGENGVPSVLGRTLAWTSTAHGGRHRAKGRHIDVSVASRGGVTTIRVEEELRHLAGGLFGGIVGGVGGGTSGLVIGAGVQIFQSPVGGFGLWALVIVGIYAATRALFASKVNQRADELKALVRRLEDQVATVAAPPASQVRAGITPRSLPGSAGTADPV